ncbi:MAG: hypothetical protein AVDCRST_MAG19-4552 [uncultured Thermomicrobiales bacterium]|uniref:Uncharacterized protein n=1 Tax=uncultured Thermomicrobiales bacterium TaxID=1645740 RepID=A0A6J4VR50_9BACT|nr:MAG: hypothetical protein AVDCRST_MAG19-4552 [uncultured Thermomicrobiales bacterium]
MATLVLVCRPDRFAPPVWEGLPVALGPLAVVGSSVSMHTASGVHDPHLSCREDGDLGAPASATIRPKTKISPTPHSASG